MHPARIAALPILLLTVIASACGGDDPAPSESRSPPGVPQTPGGGRAAPPTEGTSTASSDPSPSATLCEGAAQLGDIIQEDAFATTAPSLVGGSLTPGTYLLAGMAVYTGDSSPDAGQPDGPGPTGLYGRGTITVYATGAMRITASRGTMMEMMPSSVTEGFTFTEASASLARVCPTHGPARTLAYSTSGAGLVIAIDGAHQEKYVRN